MTRISESKVIILLALTFVTTVVLHYYPLLGENQYDDAYITYRYAANLAEGKGFTFNTYERVNSSSSLAYTLVLSGCHVLGLQNLEVVSIVLGIGSGFAVILFSVLLAGTLTRTLWVSLICLFPLSLSGSLTGWSISGMETILYTAVVMGTFFAYATNRRTVAYILVSLSMLTRPEGLVLLVAILMTEVLARRWTSEPSRFVPFLLVGVGTFAAWMTWNTMYFGNAVPHPIVLKGVALYYSPSLRENAFAIGRFFMYNFASISIVGFFLSAVIVFKSAVKWFFRRKLSKEIPGRKTQLAMGFFVVGSAFSFLVGPSSDFGRYMVHLLPVIALMAIAGYQHLVDGLSRSRFRGKTLFTYSAGILIVLVGCYQALREQRNVSAFFERTSVHQKGRKQIGGYIDRFVERDRVIISSDIGSIAYHARHHDFLDVYGLTSRRPVRAIVDGHWKDFVEEIKKEKLSWVADTRLPNGKIASFEILGAPYDYFRGVDASKGRYLDMYSPDHQTLVEASSGDGYAFVLMRIDTSVYQRDVQE